MRAKATPEIEEALRLADPRLGALIDTVVARVGPQRFEPSVAGSHFEALMRSIVFQQLSGKAAGTIYGRVVETLGGVVAPERVLAISDEALRAAGLSRGKAKYVRSLAEAVAGGDLDIESIQHESDEEVIASLCRVKGVGVWTAQMFLMFRLRRPDVLPLNDLGIQKGLQLAHGLKKPAAPGYVRRAGSRWKPYRSLACLYLWRALDTQTPEQPPIPRSGTI